MELVVQQELYQLDVDQRAMVALVDQHHLDYWLAADVLGIPLGTLKGRLAVPPMMRRYPQ